MKNDNIKGFELLSGAFKPISYKEPAEEEAKVEENIDYGVIILPPVTDEHNMEVELYPDDYVKYAQERMREYKKEHGELPKWERDAQEASRAISEAEAAEDDTRIIQKQADEAGAELDK